MPTHAYNNMAPSISDSTSNGPPSDAPTVADSSQTRSTKALVGADSGENTIKAVYPSLRMPLSPFNRDSFSLHHARLGTQEPYPTSGYIKLRSGAQRSPWPLKNATPRESLGSIDVSIMSSPPPSLQARTVSDVSDGEGSDQEADARASKHPAYLPPPNSFTTAMGNHQSGHATKPRSASIGLDGRPLTPVPSPTLRVNGRSIDEHLKDANDRKGGKLSVKFSVSNAHPTLKQDDSVPMKGSAGAHIRLVTSAPSGEVAPAPKEAPLVNGHSVFHQNQPNNGPSEITDGNANLSGIRRMSSFELARCGQDFHRPSRATLRSSRYARSPAVSPVLGRRRGLVRPPTSDETRHLNEAFGHRRVVIAAGTVFIVVVVGMVSAVAIACAYAAHGIEISAGVVSWLILNGCFVLFFGCFLFAVYMRNRDMRIAHHAELLALRARNSRNDRERQDLEAQIELTSLSNASLLRRMDDQIDRRFEELMPFATAAHQNPEDTIVHIMSPSSSIRSWNSTNRRYRNPHSPPPPPPPNSPANSIDLDTDPSAPEPDSGVTPSISETSILTQLCEGVIANNATPGGAQAQNNPLLATIRESDDVAHKCA